MNKFVSLLIWPIALLALHAVAEPTLILDVRAHAVWRVTEDGAVDKFITLPSSLANVAHGADWRWIAVKTIVPKVAGPSFDRDYDRFVRVYDVATGKEVAAKKIDRWRIATTHSRAENVICVDSESERVLYLTQDPMPTEGEINLLLHVWDVRNDTETTHPIDDSIYGFRPMVVQDQVYVAWLNGRELRRLDAATGKVLPYIKRNDALQRPNNFPQGFGNISTGDPFHFFNVPGRGLLWTDGVAQYGFVSIDPPAPLMLKNAVKTESPFCDFQLGIRDEKKVLLYGRQTGGHYIDALILVDPETNEMSTVPLPFEGFRLQASEITPVARMFNSESGALVEYGIDTGEFKTIAKFGRAARVGYAGGEDTVKLQFHEDLKILATF